jgi:hypothetical protein
MKPVKFSNLADANQYAKSVVSGGLGARVEDCGRTVFVWVWSREGEYA